MTTFIRLPSTSFGKRLRLPEKAFRTDSGGAAVKVAGELTLTSFIMTTKKKAG